MCIRTEFKELEKLSYPSFFAGGREQGSKKSYGIHGNFLFGHFQISVNGHYMYQLFIEMKKLQMNATCVNVCTGHANVPQECNNVPVICSWTANRII